MSQRHAELLGRALAGTYVVERLLGTGGMGAVYAARHARTGGLVAVKILDAEAASDEEVFRRFQSEARIVSALRHPHIVQVIDFDEDDDGTPFLVMELLEGQDLHQRLRRVERLPLAAVVELGRQVGGALHAAHQLGVVHRDVKPQNIFLSRHQLTDEVVEVAKVVDFGISKIREQASHTQDRAVLGTPYYMSPEAAQAQNDDLDGRSDQWGLAVILYRALTGKLPYTNPDPLAVLYQVVNEAHVPIGEVLPDLPGQIAAAIDRAMQKRKEDRFPTMAEFVRAIERGFVTSATVGAASAIPARPPANELLPSLPPPLPHKTPIALLQEAARSAPPPPNVSSEYPIIEVVSQDPSAKVIRQDPVKRRRALVPIVLLFVLVVAILLLGLWLWRNRSPVLQHVSPRAPGFPQGQTSPVLPPPSPPLPTIPEPTKPSVTADPEPKSSVGSEPPPGSLKRPEKPSVAEPPVKQIKPAARKWEMDKDI